jgi:prepilin-type N-terminal cleavage/methylation domain-containing protein
MNILKSAAGDKRQVTGSGLSGKCLVTRHSSLVTCRGFTMIEIAISLAVIGIALVAIVGVLPLGMNVQKENREGTIINQDATVFIEAIRNGARGLDDLTNYVYAITNNWGEYVKGGLASSGANGYTYSSFYITPPYFPSLGARIYNGTNIIGLLSTPEFTDPISGAPSDKLAIFNGNYFSNHIVAYVRSISGPAVEKPPQDNQILQEDSFSYHIYCVNASVATDTNVFSLLLNQQAYSQRLAVNLHELRLTFLWPILPNGNVGSGRQTYRALVAGQIATNSSFGPMLYFYQPQSFAVSP